MNRTSVVALLALWLAAPVAVVSKKDQNWAGGNGEGPLTAADIPGAPVTGTCADALNGCSACLNMGCIMQGNVCVPTCDTDFYAPACYSNQQADFSGWSNPRICTTQQIDSFKRQKCFDAKFCDDCVATEMDSMGKVCTWYADRGGYCGMGGCQNGDCGVNDASKCGAGFTTPAGSTGSGTTGSTGSGSTGMTSGSGSTGSGATGSGSGTTVKPTVKPTAKPTVKPTVKATVKPTGPTQKPTAKPTSKPTVKPTAKPTVKPTVKPTAKPTVKPTAKPTAKQTFRPPTINAVGRSTTVGTVRGAGSFP